MQRRRQLWALWCAPAATLAVSALSAAAPLRGDDKPAAPAPIKPVSVRFTTDVLPVFTKLGCNNGSCHGQQNGKGGFKLSLRGWDPAFDFEQLTKDAKGKRVDPKDPSRSLVLLKTTGRVPHGGGALLAPYSEAWGIVTRWLNSGMPGPADTDPKLTELTVTPRETPAQKTGQKAQLQVTATFSDKTTRDVTRWARYQSQNEAVAAVTETGQVTTQGPGESAILVSYWGTVRTASVIVPFQKPTIAQSAPGDSPIDRAVESKLAQLGLTPSPLCTDAEFIRRATLDTLAELPTPDETRRFVNSTDPKKREKLVDSLLARPEYADYRALKLADLLRVNGQFLSEEGAEVFHRWIRQQVDDNVLYDRFVLTLLTSTGSTFRTGPSNYFRVAQSPEDLAETTSQAFLGTRIACAKCHNHPFENWKQADYYGFAAFFTRYGLKYGPEFG